MSKIPALILLLVPALCLDGQWRPRPGNKQIKPMASKPSPVSHSNGRVAPSPAADGASFPLPAGFTVEPSLDTSKAPSTPGAKLIKIRQGPFSIPVGRALKEEEQWIPEPKMPCKDCYITALQAGLEFEDGSPANTHRGAMLQHLIILSGKSRDTVCETYNLPLPNRIYYSGNERETIRVNPGNKKYGLYVDDDEWYTIRFNVVNVGTKPIKVYLTETYEVVDKSKAQGYRNVVTAYMDMGGCGGTYFSPKQGQMTLKSFIWSSVIDGDILFTHGHVHEGGLNTVLYLNEKPICTSSNIYGRTIQSIDPQGKKHISDVSICTNMGRMKWGDLVQITSTYNSSAHPFDESMPKNGFEYVMAINNIYIGV